MDYQAATRLLPASYLRIAEEAKKSVSNKIQELLEKRKWPEEGWSDSMLEAFLHEIALMDSSNFLGSVGVGEREGRVFSKIVHTRHWGLSHGIGRSGDLVEPQPKAVGSSLVNKLTNALSLDAIKICGITSVQNCFVAPVATGMALSLVLSTLRHKRPSSKCVIWTRIDQKSCIKAVQLSGFALEVVDTTKNGDELNTDVFAIEQLLTKIPLEEIVCVITTTSCFAPRAFDDIVSVSELCAKYDVPHLVNNAYGLQSSKCCHLIQTAATKGRVDAFVQSTDKNFMVPVGGSIIAGFDKTFIDDISKLYPGRASASPSLDLLITLLSMGKIKFKKLLNDRKENFEKLKSGLKLVAEKHGERVLETKGNNISLAFSLSYIKGLKDNEITEFGAWLFQKRISGCRVIDVGSVKDVAGVTYQGWGSHNSSYPTPYLTVAAGIGMGKEEIDVFLNKLDTTLSEWKKKGQVRK